ncbi:MAG: hypothetical protein DHS80DRAFT_25434 [Piptocephalis tieghemiana]|nr:MAG: hypothetical protein DHS80DRAFT_25434 [Piptocephalis tieghemiana]
MKSTTTVLFLLIALLAFTTVSAHPNPARSRSTSVSSSSSSGSSGSSVRSYDSDGHAELDPFRNVRDGRIVQSAAIPEVVFSAVNFALTALKSANHFHYGDGWMSQEHRDYIINSFNSLQPVDPNRNRLMQILYDIWNHSGRTYERDIRRASTQNNEKAKVIRRRLDRFVTRLTIWFVLAAPLSHDSYIEMLADIQKEWAMTRLRNGDY